MLFHENLKYTESVFNIILSWERRIFFPFYKSHISYESSRFMKGFNDHKLVAAQAQLIKPSRIPAQASNDLIRHLIIAPSYPCSVQRTLQIKAMSGKRLLFINVRSGTVCFATWRLIGIFLSLKSRVEIMFLKHFFFDTALTFSPPSTKHIRSVEESVVISYVWNPLLNPS